MKKIIAVLSLALFLQNMGFFPVHAAAEVSGESDEAVKIGCEALYAYYNIIPETILSDQVITRGEFANIICNLLKVAKLDIKYGTEYMLEDSGANSDYWEDISGVLSSRYMSAEMVDGKYYFYPDSEMKYADAVETMLCLLGYAGCFQNSDEENFQIAKRIGLIQYSDSVYTRLSPGRLKNLIFSMLCTEVVYPVTTDRTDGYRSTEKTFLEGQLNMYFVDGILETTSLLDIYGREPLKTNRVRLEGEIFISNLAVENYEYIGNYVRAFIVNHEKDGGLDEIVTMTLYENRNSSALLDRSEEISCADGFTTIWHEGDKRIRYRIDGDANVFYNFSYLGHPGTINTADAQPAQILNNIGSHSSMEIALKDIDDDGDYDFVWFRDFTDVVLTKFDFGKMKITTDQDVCYIIQEAYYNFSFVSVGDDGAVFNPKNLAKNNVISMFYEMDSTEKITRCVMYVSQKSVTGEITESGTDGYGIGGDLYKAAKVYEEKAASGLVNAPKLKVGLAAKFFLNKFGDICGCDTSAVTSTKEEYGFLTRANKGKGLDGDTTVELYSTSGDKEYYIIADRCMINGEKTKKETVFQLLYDEYKKDFTSPTDIIIYSLVKYQAIEDEITKLEIAVKDPTEDRLYPVMPLDSSVNGLSETFYKAETIGRKIGLSDQTVIFSLPTVETYMDALNDDTAITANPSMYVDCIFGVADVKSQGTAATMGLKMEFYDLDKTHYAGAAVRYYKYVGSAISGSLPEPAPLTTAFTVSKVCDGINENGEKVLVFYGYEGYVEKRLVSVPIKDENDPWKQFTTIFAYDFEKEGTGEKFKLSDIKSGDVVTFYQTTKSEVLNIAPLVRGGSKEESAWLTGHTGNINVGIGYGTVVAVDGGHILVHELDGADRVYSVTSNSDMVMYNRKNQSAYLSNTDDIEVGMDICFKSYYSSIRHITVFDN